MVAKLAARCLVMMNPDLVTPATAVNPSLSLPLSLPSPNLAVVNMLRGYLFSQVKDPDIVALFDQDYDRFRRLVMQDDHLTNDGMLLQIVCVCV